ncbi:MAG: Arm DNA-binding domain-containing protein [Alphaproteobacteria bacterium]|nr:Arm DNA-binding domain-containing protein [Alphaproteobacteria bacterium]
MSNVCLTRSRIKALKPRKVPYDIRDSELKGFGVRVLPSGAKRFFVHSQHEGKRLWKTIGDTDSVGLDEARRQAAGLLAIIRRDEAPTLPEDRIFEAVAEDVSGCQEGQIFAGAGRPVWSACEQRGVRRGFVQLIGRSSVPRGSPSRSRMSMSFQS